MSSADGVTWEETLSAPGTTFDTVAHGGNRFVAAGSGTSGSSVVTSADGRTWSAPSPLPFTVSNLTYGKGTWVAMGTQREVATSSDGATWTSGSTGLTESYTFVDDVAYGDGSFLGLVSQCGASRCFSYGSITSTDGASWTPLDESLTFPAAQPNGLAFTDRFGAVGYEWGELPPNAPMVNQRADAAAGLMDEAGTFQPIRVVPAELQFMGLTSQGSGWVAVAQEGVQAAQASVWTSPDLATWTKLSTPDGMMEDIAISGGSATPSSPPTRATTAPAGAPVVLTENGIRVTAPDGTVSDFTVNSGSWTQVIAALRATLGAPTNSSEECALSEVWDGFSVVSADEGTLTAVSSFTGPDVRANKSVATTGGVHAGDPLTAFIAAHPAARQVRPHPNNFHEGPDPYFEDVDGNGRGLVIDHDGATVTSIRVDQPDPRKEFQGAC